ncbi:MAG: hypothetical protein IIW86_01930 [Clostridia bacterium]|nr:hypothetical protein [Clostridia bacterium]
MTNLKDLKGQKFGRLTVLERAANHISKSGSVRSQWLCKCECGKEIIVAGTNLTSGHTLSCGCIRAEKQFKKHGLRHTKIYNVWNTIKQRCNNPNVNCYERYGGRGIKICDEWLDFMAFYNWAITNDYKEGLSIDRINNNGNYEPSNCQWVNAKSQANNRRSSRYITYNNETHTVAEWSRITGIKSSTLFERIKHNRKFL